MKRTLLLYFSLALMKQSDAAAEASTEKNVRISEAV